MLILFITLFLFLNFSNRIFFCFYSLYTSLFDFNFSYLSKNVPFLLFYIVLIFKFLVLFLFFGFGEPIYWILIVGSINSNGLC